MWRCEPILDSGLADRLTALSDKVDRLSTDLGDLSLRVDTLAAGAGALPACARGRRQGRSASQRALRRRPSIACSR